MACKLKYPKTKAFLLFRVFSPATWTGDNPLRPACGPMKL